MKNCGRSSHNLVSSLKTRSLVCLPPIPETSFLCCKWHIIAHFSCVSGPTRLQFQPRNRRCCAHNSKVNRAPHEAPLPGLITTSGVLHIPRTALQDRRNHFRHPQIQDEILGLQAMPNFQTIEATLRDMVSDGRQSLVNFRSTFRLTRVSISQI